MSAISCYQSHCCRWVMAVGVYEDSYEKIKFNITKEERKRGTKLIITNLLIFFTQSLWICLPMLKHPHLQKRVMQLQMLSAMRLCGSTNGRKRRQLNCTAHSPAHKCPSGLSKGERGKKMNLQFYYAFFVLGTFLKEYGLGRHRLALQDSSIILNGLTLISTPDHTLCTRTLSLLMQSGTLFTIAICFFRPQLQIMHSVCRGHRSWNACTYCSLHITHSYCLYS